MKKIITNFLAPLVIICLIGISISCSKEDIEIDQKIKTDVKEQIKTVPFFELAKNDTIINVLYKCA